jgi:DNA mismatch repair protein MutL
MPKINLLSEDLINKIAAGEVIERPASVVKELVENSLDAKATKIKIEIKDSGKKLIKISDNGSGMEEEDAKKSILRHATSKIQEADDLFDIHTLGFRGEALASIAAVSRIGIITKKKDKLEGYNLVLEGGKIISSGIIGADSGTTIEVHDIFFNTPARKKFLKTDAVELRHIIDIVIRYALINKNVAFELVHDNHQLLNSPAIEDYRGKIASIYGTNMAKNLLEVNFENNDLKISGFIVKPFQARNDKTQQQTYVNNRWVRNNDISKAVYDSYHSLLFVGKHPVFILNIEVDPKRIDVNVHPAKTEIKIEQKDLVYSSVLEAVNGTLKKHNLIPEVDLDYEDQLTFGTPKKEVKSNVPEVKYVFDKSNQEQLDPVVNTEIYSEEELLNQNQEKNGEFYASPEEDVFIREENKVVEGNYKIPAMKLLGQIHKTFFVAEVSGGLLLIDQHVVQERVFYEKFMKELMNNKVTVQKLLKGGVLEFSPAEKLLVEENLGKLEEFGFKLEPFGGNTFLLKTVPSLFGKVQAKELVYSVLAELKEGKSKLEEIQEEIITRMACRASVKAGDTLTNTEMESMLKELERCKLPYTCPHGRAVLIKVSADELEKKFKRK